MPAQLVKISKKKTLAEYPVLRSRVREVFVLGRERIEKELVRLRWETGRLIIEHVRLNGGRASYGQQAILKLEEDLGIDHSELGRFAQFAAAYPISVHGRKLKFNLPWSYYRRLITIQDDRKRFELTLRAEKSTWSLEQLENHIWQIQHNEDETPFKLPFVCLGPFYTYKIIRPESIRSRAKDLLVDFGFGHTVELNQFEAARFMPETIVTAGQARSLIKVEAADDESLYTYKAYVEEVLDGDTLKLEIPFGFGQLQREKFRLNGINCPELDTPEGKAAKRFVESELAGCEFITLKSTRTKKEKWGRYLGDVFYTQPKQTKMIYLNQLLLDKGHAVPMSW